MKWKREERIKEKDKKITHLSQQLTEYGLQVKKCKDRIQSLTEQLKRLQKNSVDNITNIDDADGPPVISYFSHTTFVDKDIDNNKKIDIMGHFVFMNISRTTFYDPIICFRVKPISNIEFGGKIDIDPLLDKEKPSKNKEGWEYVQENWKEWVEDKGEHWLKPIHFNKFGPNQAERFSNINITLKPTNDYSHYAVEGFFFATNQKTGIPAVNTISIYL